MTKIYGVLLDVEKCKIEPVAVDKDNSYDEIKALIGCRCVDIPSYRFGMSEDKPILDVYLDDEGYYNSGVMTIAECTIEGQVKSICGFGNLFVVRHDDEGDIQSLTREDILDVMGCARLYMKDGKRIPLLDVVYPYWDAVAELEKEFGDAVLHITP